MAFREKLEILVDANVQGFVRGMDAAGRSAEKNLGKSDEKLDKLAGKMQTFGAAAFSAGAVAAVGLGKLAMMAAEAEVQQTKLSNSVANSAQQFRDGGAALRDQASELQKVTAAEDDATVGMQSMLVQFGLTEDQVLSLTPLVVDLSRKMGIDMDAAAKAVGRSATGTTTALKRMGIDVEALGTGSTDAERTISALAASVGGFAEAEGKTFSGQLQIIKNQLGEIGEGVGGGILDIVKPFADLGGSLSSTNPELLTASGRIAAVGAAATIAVGGLSFLGGAAIKARTNLTTVGEDGTRSLNNLGKAARAAAIAGAALSAAFVLDAVIKSANADDANREFDRFAAGAESAQESLQTLGIAGRKLEGLWSRINPLNGGGADLITFADETGLSLRDLDRGLADLEKRGDYEGLARGLRNLKEASKDPGIDKAEQERINALIGDYRGVLKNAAGAGKEGAEAALDYADGVEDTGEAAEEATKKLKDYGTSLDLIKQQSDILTTAASAFADGLGTDGLNSGIDAAQGYAGALKSFREVAGQLPADLNLITAATGGYTEEQNKAIDALQGVGSAARESLTTLIESGQSYDTVRASAASYEQSLRDQLDALGIVGPAQDEYIQLLGLTPEQVNTAITVSGAEAARAQLMFLQEDIDALPEEVSSLIYAQIAENDWEGALATYKEFKDKTTTVTADGKTTSALTQAKTAYESFKDKTVSITFQSVGGRFAPTVNSSDRRLNGAFADGGMLPEDARIQPGSGAGLIQWAEGETGGEAFIPLAPSKRNRSVAIWAETGKRLGVMADGGMTGLKVNVDYRQTDEAIDKIVKQQKDAEASGFNPSGVGAAFSGAMANVRNVWGLAAGAFRMVQAVMAAVPGTRVSSGLRPGSITASGNQSYHSSGRAADLVGNMGGIFNFLRSSYGQLGLVELIYQNQIIKNGRPGRYSRNDHFDHVHAAAMAKGGIVKKPTFAMIGEAGPEAVIPLNKFASGGIRSFAPGGFTADTIWGAVAEMQKNRSQFLFDTASPAEQWNDLQRRLAQLAQYSDAWFDVKRQIIQMEKATADEQMRANESALAAAKDRAENEWDWNYERSKIEDQIVLATQRRDSFEQFTDEWVRWAEELEKLQKDAEEKLSPRSTASGGRSSGQAPFYLTVNVNAEGLVTDPQEVGRQVVGAIRSYEQANGSTWRN